MGKPGKNERCRRVFTLLMRQAGWKDFCFPGGGLSERAVSGCLETLQKLYGEVGPERVVDFCVCQGYAISGYGEEYHNRWKVAHSFGNKAVSRFTKSNAARRYYEDCWLKEHGLSRNALLACIADRSEHPYHRFIYPEYEEHTKRRLLSTEAGYAVCALSTLLWTPFSPACRECKSEDDCQKRTKDIFPELYRIRCEEWREKEVRP